MRRIFLWSVVLYLRFWAHVALKINHPSVIGIAGSVGKSSTRNILYAALKNHFSVANIFGNSETGIPLGILGIKPEGYDLLSWVSMLLRAPFGINYIRGKDWLIVEMGIDEPYPPRNMEYLLSIVKPEIAISLNISATHTQQFELLLKDEEHKDVKKSAQHEFLIRKIAEDDVSIVTKSDCRVGIYNKDNEFIVDEIKKMNSSTSKLLAFGMGGDITYKGYEVGMQQTDFSFEYRGEKVSLTIKNHVLPEEYRELFAACLLTASELGLDVKLAARSIEENFSLPKGRSSVFEGVNESVIIDSSYNASSVATIAFLQMIDKLRQKTKRPVIFLFGDMRELGEEAEHEHKEVADYIKRSVDYLYMVGPLTKQFVMPIFENNKKLTEVKHFENSLEAGEYMRDTMPKKALVLVKGSQNTIFLEEAVKLILKNDNDSNKLCRQEEYWMEIKRS